MKKDTEKESEMREEMGYESIELIGWASEPFYDEDTKKLHWAKEYNFGGYETNTLNYNIRVLGRSGFLELNAISGIDALADVQENIDPILTHINFNDGHKYSDFNPDIDKVAAYGIGGLIVGKALLKAGILAKAGIILAKFWKFILIGIAGLGAGFKKFFGKG